eukprot:CAMPEP_0174276876 /NCGR_PEP_ID=MMETSP0439-20130205/60628_1 /TAXON_ID=0 /ORGANISM="Stereomyxa ramosa, Strain Chinc5" /LENGTH=323 /DNA_ID=CAMNT_0015369145 /DNA_START=486 /DNA_END=1455 /DNA_ORIENTATION=-
MVETQKEQIGDKALRIQQQQQQRLKQQQRRRKKNNRKKEEEEQIESASHLFREMGIPPSSKDSNTSLTSQQVDSLLLHFPQHVILVSDNKNLVKTQYKFFEPKENGKASVPWLNTQIPPPFSPFLDPAELKQKMWNKRNLSPHQNPSLKKSLYSFPKKQQHKQALHFQQQSCNQQHAQQRKQQKHQWQKVNRAVGFIDHARKSTHSMDNNHISCDNNDGNNYYNIDLHTSKGSSVGYSDGFNSNNHNNSNNYLFKNTDLYVSSYGPSDNYNSSNNSYLFLNNGEINGSSYSDGQYYNGRQRCIRSSDLYNNNNYNCIDNNKQA